MVHTRGEGVTVTRKMPQTQNVWDVCVSKFESRGVCHGDVCKKKKPVAGRRSWLYSSMYLQEPDSTRQVASSIHTPPPPGLSTPDILSVSVMGGEGAGVTIFTCFHCIW